MILAKLCLWPYTKDQNFELPCLPPTGTTFVVDHVAYRVEEIHIEYTDGRYVETRIYLKP